MYAIIIKMALFIITGVLSLSAGLGIGALLPTHPKSRHHHEPQPQFLNESPQPRGHIKRQTQFQSIPQRVVAPGRPVGYEKPIGSPKVLDFTDFDKSLMKLVQTQEQKKNIPAPSSQKLEGGQSHSTLRKSVVENSQFYSPSTVVEGGMSPASTHSTTPRRFETSWF